MLYSFWFVKAQTVFEHKEDDFALAVKSRDEALRECQKIKGQMEAMEERERHKARKQEFKKMLQMWQPVLYSLAQAPAQYL